MLKKACVNRRARDQSGQGSKGESTMKLRSISVLLGVAAALLALTGTASATTITAPTGTVATPSFEAEGEGHLVIDIGGGLPKIECQSALKGQFKAHGEGKPAEGELTSVVNTSCTNSWHVTTIVNGTIAVNWLNAYSGTITSTGLTIEATRAGVICRFATNKTVTGTLTAGSPATLDLAGSIPFHSGSGLCGAGPFPLTGSYKLTSPTALFVDGPPFEGTGPGTTVTSPTGTISTPAVKATSKNIVIDLSLMPKIECSSELNGRIETHGVSRTASGIVGISFSACASGWHVPSVVVG